MSSQTGLMGSLRLPTDVLDILGSLLTVQILEYSAHHKRGYLEHSDRFWG